MKSKAPLFLMEQLVMVLVFALAAALCLNVFVQAQQISDAAARQDEAVLIAQNAAELLKAGISPKEVENRLEEAGYEVRIVPLPEGISGLQQVEITVFYEQTAYVSLTAGYREVDK